MLVDNYGDVAQTIDGEIQTVEREVFSVECTNPAEQIYKLEREVLDLYGVVAPLSEAVDEIADGRFEAVPDELLAFPTFRLALGREFRRLST